MSLNFDAKITLDVSEFLASAKKAEAAIGRLESKIKNLNGLKVNPSVTGKTSTSTASKSSAPSMNINIAPALGQLTRLENKVKETVAFINAQKPTLRMNTTQNQVKTRQSEAKDINDAADAYNKMDSARNSSVRNMARERYALYDVAAAYQTFATIGTGALRAMVNASTEYERAFVDVVRTTEFQSIKAGEAARVMKVAFMDLAANIPVDFKGITQIATIGNQLGISQGKLKDFTQTIAEFSTLTGVSTESAALSFGRIGELLNITEDPLAKNRDAYTMLGSAIAYAGVKAVATEQQILAVTKEIATTAKMAKFGTGDVVGLATALSSLGIAPEAARGSIIRSFAAINEAVGAGGAKLQAYADVAGMSGEAFAATWKKDGQKAFDAFLKGLQGMSDQGQNLDSVLRGLGIHNVRDIQTIQKLGDNYNVYADAIRNANEGFQQGTFLAIAYGKIQETVAAKIQIIQNKWQNLMSVFGDINADGFKFLLDIIEGVIDALTRFARNPAGRFIIQLVTAATALATAVAAVNAVVALAKATMLAFATALANTSKAELAAGEAANVMSAGFSKAKLAAQMFTNTLKAAGWMALIMGAVQAVSWLGDMFQNAFDHASYSIRKAEEALGSFAGLQEALNNDYLDAFAKYGSDAAIAAAIAAGEIDGMTISTTALTNEQQRAIDVTDGLATITSTDLSGAINGVTGDLRSQTVVLGENYKAWIRNAVFQSEKFQDIAGDTTLTDALKEIGYSFDAASRAAREGTFNQYFKNLRDQAAASGKDVSKISDMIGQLDWGIGPLQDLKNVLEGSANEAFLLGVNITDAKDAVEKLGKAPQKFIEETRNLKKAFTIWDYIAELQTKLKTAFDWRFSAQAAADKVVTAWRSVSKTFAEASKKIADVRNEMAGLTANRKILEYQLSVAIAYGDVLRQNQIQAKIGELDSKLASSAQELTDAQQGASKTLIGNSDAAVQNRSTLQDLTTTTIDWLVTQKLSGKTTKEMIISARQQRQAFIDQAVAMGFSKNQLDEYVGAFDDYIKLLKQTGDKLDLPMKVYLNFDGADAAIHKWKVDNASLTIKVKLLNPDYEAWIAKRDEFFAAQNGPDSPFQSGPGDLIPAGPTTGSNAKGSKQNPYLLTNAPASAGYANPLVKRIPLGSYYQFSSKKDFVYSSAVEGNQLVIRYGSDRATGSMMAIAQPVPTGPVKAQGYATGGLISGFGSGTSDSIPIMASSGEFMMQASAVKAYGVDFLNALNQQQIPRSLGNASSGGGQAGSQVVFLSPDDRALLRQAIDRPVNLYTENTKIAQSANAGNVVLAQRGSN